MWKLQVMFRWLLILVGLSLFPNGSGADDPKRGRVVLEAKGYLIPARQTTVSPRVSGQIIEVRIEEGQRVKKGEVLASLDPAEYEAALRVAQAELKVAVAKGKRLADVNVAQAEIELAEARVVLAKLRLDGTVIRSPINGTVLTLHADVGTQLDPKGFQVPVKLCDIADLEMMDVEVWVLEKDIEKIAKKQSCMIRLEGFAGANYQGTVARIGPVADRTKGAMGVRIRLEVPKNDRRLRPELSAVVQFLAKE